ncbi:MAG: MgtC/SapB family protein [Phenylobacterium sp.]
MLTIDLEILRNLVLAMAAGLAIGAERSVNGRASAGLRTYGLVALASATVATIAYLPPGVLKGDGGDPGRLAQGVMTGLGFLGAGVIFKEGVSVQGLTTAAAVWATAAVGLLFGFGMWQAGLLATAALMFIMLAMRWVEGQIRWPAFAMAVLRFKANSAPTEAALRGWFAGEAAVVSDMSYKLIKGGKTFEYLVNLRTRDSQALSALAARLKDSPDLVEFELSLINK